MSTEPTLDQFRRYLQEQILEAEEINIDNEKNQRLLQLEIALQEAIKFSSEVSLRKEHEKVVFEESKAVRLLTPNNPNEFSVSSNDECPKCETNLDAELDFCPTCEYKK
ncbi:MAG: hypothetical protein CMO20_05065 [Thermoplasmata archaeon]|nr:hypothetical protein [Thermoplasmata archaeon]